MSVTIAPPPCPGSTVPSNFTYTGTYNLSALRPPVKAESVVKVQLQLQTGPTGMLTAFSTQTTGSLSTGTGDLRWQLTSADTSTKQHVTATATLLIDGTPQANPFSLSDFNIAAAGSTATSCAQFLAAPGNAAAYAPAATAARVEELLAEAVRGSAAPPPDGYEFRPFAGVYLQNLDDPTVDIRARIERRYSNHLRVTKSVARGVAFLAGVWTTFLYVPTTMDPGAHDVLVVEFFAASGVWSQTAYTVSPT